MKSIHLTSHVSKDGNICVWCSEKCQYHIIPLSGLFTWIPALCWSENTVLAQLEDTKVSCMHLICTSAFNNLLGTGRCGSSAIRQPSRHVQDLPRHFKVLSKKRGEPWFICSTWEQGRCCITPIRSCQTPFTHYIPVDSCLWAVELNLKSLTKTKGELVVVLGAHFVDLALFLPWAVGNIALVSCQLPALFPAAER